MKGPVFLDPVWQRVWHWPAVANLVLGGTGAGFFLACLLVEGAGGPDAGAISPVVRLKWVGAVMVLTGFAAVALEAGRPSSARYLLGHLRTSWMSREVSLGLLFIGTAILDAVFARDILAFFGGLTASGFLLSQGMMVNRARAVAAWNLEIVPVHFVSSGLCLGCGMLLMGAAATGSPVAPQVLLVVLGLLVFNAMTWFAYVHFFADTRSGQATLVLRDLRSLLLTLGVGHLMPLGLIALLLGISGPDVRPLLQQGALGVAAAAILAGGVRQKSAIILQAYRLREVRGSRCAG